MINLICEQFEKVDLSKYGKFNLSFLDPPDNAKIKYENYKDNLKTEEYINLLGLWVLKACSITEGPVFVSVAEKWVSAMEYIIRNNSIPLYKRIYWYYSFGQANKNTYSPCIRNIYWLNKPIIYPENIKIPSDRLVKYNDKRANPKGKMPSNLWDFSRICGTFKERRSWYPCQHPEALIERIILGHSQVNDNICDAFAGTGVVPRICKKHNRNCVSIEISDFYIQKIKEELKLENQ